MAEVATTAYFTYAVITQLFIIQNGRQPSGIDEVARYLGIPEGTTDVYVGQHYAAVKLRACYPGVSDDDIIATLTSHPTVEAEGMVEDAVEDAEYDEDEVADIAKEINIEALFVTVTKGLYSHSDNNTSIGALEQHYNATVSSSAAVTPDLIKRMCVVYHCSPSDLPTTIPSYAKFLSDMHAKEADGVKEKLQRRIEAALEKNTASVEKASSDLQQLANKGLAEVHLDKAMKLKDYIEYGLSLEKMFDVDAMDI
jgi:hypothetical protein